MKRDPNNHTQPATDYKAEFAWTISWVEGCSHGKSKHQRHSSTHDIISMLSCRIQCAKSERCADEMKWNPSQQSCNIIGSHSGIIKFKSIKAIHSKSVKLYPRPHISLDMCTKNTQYVTVSSGIRMSMCAHTFFWMSSMESRSTFCTRSNLAIIPNMSYVSASLTLIPSKAVYTQCKKSCGALLCCNCAMTAWPHTSALVHSDSLTHTRTCNTVKQPASLEVHHAVQQADGWMVCVHACMHARVRDVEKVLTTPTYRLAVCTRMTLYVQI